MRMKEFESKYESMVGKWVTSDGDYLFWDTDDNLECVAFRSKADAVRDIQCRECSPKKSLQTTKWTETHHTYKCRTCDGNLVEYNIYKITVENKEYLASIVSG